MENALLRKTQRAKIAPKPPLIFKVEKSGGRFQTVKSPIKNKEIALRAHSLYTASRVGWAFQNSSQIFMPRWQRLKGFRATFNQFCCRQIENLTPFVYFFFTRLQPGIVSLFFISCASLLNFFFVKSPMTSPETPLGFPHINSLPVYIFRKPASSVVLLLWPNLQPTLQIFQNRLFYQRPSILSGKSSCMKIKVTCSEIIPHQLSACVRTSITRVF